MKGKNQMRKSLGFTLAEVLITLAIIGVVAAMTIPSVIINTNQQEYKTGLKKAVSVLNQAITMNMALENLSPSDTVNATPTNINSNERTLMRYLGSRLNVIRETDTLTFGSGKNAAFYTADGMRFEFPKKAGLSSVAVGSTVQLGHCTASTPCEVLVDVNGDRKPNPSSEAAASYDVPGAGDNRISDVFHIFITDTAATPAGVVAQKTMFQAD